MAHTKGDIFQILPSHGRTGWVGLLIIATEIKSWGIQGYCAYPATHEQQLQAFIRLKWEDIIHVGHVVMENE